MLYLTYYYYYIVSVLLLSYCYVLAHERRGLHNPIVVPNKTYTIIIIYIYIYILYDIELYYDCAILIPTFTVFSLPTTTEI